LVGVLRIELSSDAPHAPILPVNYTPKLPPGMRILTDLTPLFTSYKLRVCRKLPHVCGLIKTAKKP